jgi:indolepyruvate ferredoxin oxidoreductase alpha subunit
MIPAHARARLKVLNEKQKLVQEIADGSRFNWMKKTGKEKIGVIAFGSAYNYAAEYATKEYAMMKVATYPFPEKKIKEFLVGLEKVLVFEECEPILEEKIRCMHPNVEGKLTGKIPKEGELTPDIAAKAYGKELPAPKSVGLALPPRPPSLCPGCPHTSLYNSLKKVAPTIVAGDIGCYTLGVGMGTLHTCLCMGAGISQAAGMSHSGLSRVAAVIGESTFLHSGVTALLNAVYNNANILVLILDNSAVAMTGHQPTPLSGTMATGQIGGKISLEEIVKACNVASLDIVDPYKEVDTEKLMRTRIDEPGVKVMISRGPCIIVKKRMAKK